MRCPYCQWNDSKVVDSRDVDDGVRRRRECLNPDCGGRFTTYERIQAVALYVIKKDGRREEFSREKVRAGIRRSCANATGNAANCRPISVYYCPDMCHEVSVDANAATPGRR